MRRKPNDIFAFKDMLSMCAFHRRSEVMVIPRYLACDTVSSSCPWSMYWVLMIVLFLVTGMTFQD